MSDHSALNPEDIFRLARASLIVLFIMIIFEVIKSFSINNVSLLGSHVITIFFITFAFIIFFNYQIGHTKKEIDTICQESSEYENKYLSLVKNVPIGVFRTSVDSNGHFISANPVTIKMFDLTDLDINSIRVGELYKSQSRREEIRDKLSKYGIIEKEESEFITPKGRTFWGEVSAILKKDQAGQTYFEGYITDISALKKAQETISIQNLKISESKDPVNTPVSHV